MERSLEACRNYIRAQSELPHAPHREPRLFVTISRQAGAGGITIAEKLGEILAQKDRSARVHWTVFDKNLLETVLKEHRLPSRFGEFMPEDAVSEIREIVEELLGMHPSNLTLLRDTTSTILHLAQAGNAIIVGRAANVVTQRLEGGFHVRLIGSVKRRTVHLQNYYRLSEAEASKLLRAEDRGRRKYVKHYFGKDIDDPLLYDMVINTDHVTFEEAANIIARTVLTRKTHVQNA